MDIEEMKKYEWVVPWSGGKDSTATILLMLHYNVPIKYVYHVRMMYDNKNPATLPIVNDFIDRTSEIFYKYNIDVRIYNSKCTALDLANKIFTRSKTSCKNGCKYGCFAFMRGACCFEKYKEVAVPKEEKIMVGYACDEYNRIHRLNDNKQSIMVSLEIPEYKTFGICSFYDMLSPVYYNNIARDGCFFCPNAGKSQRDYIKVHYPELYDKVLDMINMNVELHDYMTKYKDRNNWFKDYIDSKCYNPQISYLT